MGFDNVGAEFGGQRRAWVRLCGESPPRQGGPTVGPACRAGLRDMSRPVCTRFDIVGTEFGGQRRAWVRLCGESPPRQGGPTKRPARQAGPTWTCCGNCGWGGRIGGGLRVRGRVLG